jgi:hypothetical protein
MRNPKRGPVYLSKAEVEELFAARMLRERVPSESDLPRILEPLKTRLARGKPEYLVPIPQEGATKKNCWLNVSSYVDSHGGERCPGWHIICQWNLYYLKCIPHVVVKVKEELLDVTPPELESRILFVPDDSVTIQTKCRIIGLTTKPKARRVIAAVSQWAAFEEKYWIQRNENPEREPVQFPINELPFTPP